MTRLLDYVFIFLIGYQTYFLYYLFSSPAPNQIASLVMAVCGIILWFLVLSRIQKHSYKHVTMAITTGILSISSLIIYFLLFSLMN